MSDGPSEIEKQAQLAKEAFEATLRQIQEMAAQASTALAGAKQAEETARASAGQASTLASEITPINSQAKAMLETASKLNAELPPLAEQIRQRANETAPIVEQIKTWRGEALGYLEGTKTDTAKTAEIAKTADEKDRRVKEYEGQLNEIAKKCRELEKNLRDLLPQATGVGLAKSFNARRVSLKLPLIGYFTMFLVSVVGFIGLGWYGIFVEKISSIEHFFRFLLERTPIVVGLILLEEFSRRQFSATTKLEEDYAYKETISIAFDGYKKAMMELQGVAPDALSSQFSARVIETLHLRPGRLLEGEEKAMLPLAELLAAPTEAGEKASSGAIPVKAVLDRFRGVWIRNSVGGLLVLLLGAAAGYYVASKGPHIEASTTVTPAQQTSEPAKPKAGEKSR